MIDCGNSFVIMTIDNDGDNSKQNRESYVSCLTQAKEKFIAQNVFVLFVADAVGGTSSKGDYSSFEGV